MTSEQLLILLLAAVIAALAAALLRCRTRRETGELATLARRMDRLLQQAELPPDPAHRGDPARLAGGMQQLADQLTETRRRLEKERRKAYYILDNMDSGLLVLGGDGTIRQCNSSVYKYFADHEELVGRTLAEACPAEELHRAVKNAVQNEVSSVFDLDLTASTGVIVSVRVTPAMGGLFGEGSGVSALVVLTNVTQSRQMERMRSEFIANISHELKTPITSIQGFTELITSGVVTDEGKKAEYLSRIGEESRRMSNLIDDILRLSSLESRQAEEVSEPVELRALCEDVFHSLEPIMHRRGITGEVIGSAVYRADPDDLRQLVKNLIENAVKYNRENGRVTVRLSPDAYQCVIGVADTGIGIPLEHQSRIFERFYRVDKGRSKREGGTGLGLSIVKHITAKYGGRITLASRPEEGTSIRVTLPVEQRG